MMFSKKLVRRYQELKEQCRDGILLMQVGAGVMKIILNQDGFLSPLLFRDLTGRSNGALECWSIAKIRNYTVIQVVMGLRFYAVLQYSNTPAS